MPKPGSNDPNYIKIADGVNMDTPIDDAFREKLINELRTFPNIFLICGDKNAATHTIQVGTDQNDLKRAVISVFRKHKEAFEFMQDCIKDV